MTATRRGSSGRGVRRRLAAGIALAVAAAVVTGCPSPEQEADPTRTEQASRSPDPAPPAPPTAAPDGDRATVEPAVAVDLTSDGPSAGSALGVAGARRGAALVLVGEPPTGQPTRLLTVTADGERTGSIPVPRIVTAWDLHLLPDATALVSGRLAGVDAIGYALVEPTTRASRSVVALPLEEGTSSVFGRTAVSPDGRTVWLYSSMLVDGRYHFRLTAHEAATGRVVGSRDLVPDLRNAHVADQALDLVGLAVAPDGRVVLAVNTFPPRNPPAPAPTLLVYDRGLAPVTGPLSLAPRDVTASARALDVAADGTAYVVLRSFPFSTLVALPSSGGSPQSRLALTGFGHTDALLVLPGGQAVLPGPDGARTIDLDTGAVTDVDVGCRGDVAVGAVATATTSGAWLLGSCLEDGAQQTVLWRIS